MKLLIMVFALFSGPLLARGAKSKVARAILIGLSLNIGTLIALVIFAQADCNNFNYAYMNCSYLSGEFAFHISTALIAGFLFGSPLVVALLLLAGFFEYRAQSSKT